MKKTPNLTILTDPVSMVFQIKKKLRHSHFMKYVSPKKSLSSKKSKYGGHPAVTRCLVEGLQRIGMSFNYNPTHLTDVGEVVVVLASKKALRQAIKWKQNGRINRLLAGPNLVVLPSDNKALITAPEIDLYLVNSNWTRKTYVEDAPELIGKIAIWPAGVDTERWKPTDNSRNHHKILIYQKNGPSELVAECWKFVEKQGYQVSQITYGHYQSASFLQKLQESNLAIFFSQSESQGIALVEAWSVDVPTLVWNQGYVVYQNKKLLASSAPYLSAQTGLFFSSMAEFKTAFSRWQNTISQFSPRQWVVENMTDEICARQLYLLASNLRPITNKSENE